MKAIEYAACPFAAVIDTDFPSEEDTDTSNKYCIPPHNFNIQLKWMVMHLVDSCLPFCCTKQRRFNLIQMSISSSVSYDRIQFIRCVDTETMSLLRRNLDEQMPNKQPIRLLSQYKQTSPDKRWKSLNFKGNQHIHRQWHECIGVY